MVALIQLGDRRRVQTADRQQPRCGASVHDAPAAQLGSACHLLRTAERLAGRSPGRLPVTDYHIRWPS